MCAEYAIENDLKYFEIDNNETNVDKNMQQGNHRPLEHLLLTKRKQHNILPSFTFPIAEIFILTQTDIPHDLPNLFREKPDSEDCYENEETLLDVAHGIAKLVFKLRKLMGLIGLMGLSSEQGIQDCLQSLSTCQPCIPVPPSAGGTTQSTNQLINQSTFHTTFDPMKKDYILDAASASRKLERMAYEIVENNIDEKELILAGIRESGSVVARCIEQLLAKIGSLKTTVITLSLDKKHPKEVKISQDIDFSGKVIIVIDDVANSGKTMLYAMKPFLDFHPKKIQTLALG